MGFGLLFIGYFFMMSLPVNGIDMLPDIVGCLIMLAALNRLIIHCKDNRNFKTARLILFPFAALSIAVLGCQLAKASGMMSEGFEKFFFSPLEVVYMLIIGVFHVFLLLGIYELSVSVELQKLANRSRRILVLTAVYYICEILAASGVTKLIANSTGTPDMVLSYINLAIYLMGSLWLLFTWALIFTCYMRICLEGDEDMPYREDVHDKIIKYLKSKKKNRKGR